MPNICRTENSYETWGACVLSFRSCGVERIASQYLQHCRPKTIVKRLLKTYFLNPAFDITTGRCLSCIVASTKWLLYCIVLDTRYLQRGLLLASVTASGNESFVSIHRLLLWCHYDFYWCGVSQGSATNADEWASRICSKLEAASHYAPRGKNARHADIIHLLRIISSSVDTVLNSLKELQVTDRQDDTCDSSVLKNSQSTVLWYPLYNTAVEGWFTVL